MNLYGFDYTSLDMGLIDPHMSEYLSTSHEMITDRRNREREVQNLLKLSNSLLINSSRTVSSDPPKHRHDGTSPLPLGMDWSSPPQTWDGPKTVWPNNFHTGWSYCVTIPSWSFLSMSEGSERGVFYRVQVGLQSPQGVTTTNEVLRRFSDFLKLSSDLKQSYRHKKLPPAPPKGLFKIKHETVLEERRASLEDWITKVLSDIDISRSVSVACFLELEAVARLSFRESSHDVPEINFGCSNSCSSDPVAGQLNSTSAFASNGGSATEVSDNGSELPVKNDNSVISNGIPVYLDDAAIPGEVTLCGMLSGNNNSILSGEALSMAMEQNQFLTATGKQIATSKTDVEDLVARLNQEHAVRQYLTVKINDLETELETTKRMAKENLEQALSTEEERITEMQWRMEELRRRCMEMELKLKAVQDEDFHHKEITETSDVKENEMIEEFDSVREQLRNLQKSHEEAELTKSEVKLLAKEIKSLRNSQLELRKELDNVAKERSEFEKKLQKEREEREHINAVNTKLLHDCETLRGQLGELNVNSTAYQENELKHGVWSSSDACDRFAAAENEIDPSS